MSPVKVTATSVNGHTPLLDPLLHSQALHSTLPCGQDSSAVLRETSLTSSSATVSGL